MARAMKELSNAPKQLLDIYNEHHAAELEHCRWYTEHEAELRASIPKRKPKDAAA